MNVIDLLYLYNTGATERYVLIKDYANDVFGPYEIDYTVHLKENGNA